MTCYTFVISDVVGFISDLQSIEMRNRLIDDNYIRVKHPCDIKYDANCTYDCCVNDVINLFMEITTDWSRNFAEMNKYVAIFQMLAWRMLVPNACNMQICKYRWWSHFELFTRPVETNRFNQILLINTYQLKSIIKLSKFNTRNQFACINMSINNGHLLIHLRNNRFQYSLTVYKCFARPMRTGWYWLRKFTTKKSDQLLHRVGILLWWRKISS